MRGEKNPLIIERGTQGNKLLAVVQSTAPTRKRSGIEESWGMNRGRKREGERERSESIKYR